MLTSVSVYVYVCLCDMFGRGCKNVTTSRCIYRVDGTSDCLGLFTSRFVSSKNITFIVIIPLPVCV